VYKTKYLALAWSQVALVESLSLIKSPRQTPAFRYYRLMAPASSMLIDGHFEGSSTRSGGRTLSLLDRITPRDPTTPHYRFTYRRLLAPASSMLIDGHFEGSLTRSGGRTLSLLDRITPRDPRGSGLGEYSLRDQHRRLVGAHRQERRGTASGKKFRKRGRSCTKVFCTMTCANC
jgi:hypothetical protein